MKKLIWGIATAAAIILAIFAMRGFPPVEHGTEGTVGAAKKYQATQLTPNGHKEHATLLPGEKRGKRHRHSYDSVDRHMAIGAEPLQQRP